ncbi:MAG TPA: hypothetical protein VMZ91_05965 [Candidatus Paceibacterota bacterium]|nr:hypothetical protein [Candidatus Paceibacterota bacterium]
MRFETGFTAYLIATISAKSKEKAQGLLEKRIGSRTGFKILRTIDSGFQSDKKGIIGIGIDNGSFYRNNYPELY